MSDYAIIFQILGVICALFFIFLTVMNFKTWRWFHALTTFAVFCAVVTFMVYASLVMKTRLAWIQSVATFTEANEKQAKTVDKIINGHPEDPTPIETPLAHHHHEPARALGGRAGYVPSRTKQFCTNGGIADYHVIYANTDPSKGPAGIASFLVPKGTPGLRMGRKEQKPGGRARHTTIALPFRNDA